MNKKNELEIILSLLKPQIVCLSELALKQEEVTHFCLSSYQLVTNYCRGAAARGGGVGIYVEDKLISLCKVIDIHSYCRDKILEAAAFLLCLGKEKYLFICAYRTPSEVKKEVDEFMEYLTELFDYLTELSSNIIIVGDINIDVLASNYRRDRLQEFLNIYNLHSVINVPTRVDAALDIILTNILSSDYTSQVHQTYLSDHWHFFIIQMFGKPQ